MEKFQMLAKTMQGLEEILAEELRALGAEEVEPGRRSVSFVGDNRIMYLANLWCRTALRILRPIYTFVAKDTDELYDKVKEYDWSTLLSPSKTFSISDTISGQEFTHSKYAVYRAKDAIADWFRDHYGPEVRPNVRLNDADVQINLHIANDQVTLSLDSSGTSLHQRGWRMEQTDAPLNEVLAAGIILKTGWRGECDFVDPMCGSGTFLVEAALIATNTPPGIFRKSFAFEKWPDFDPDLFAELSNDDSQEREFEHKIYGADIDVKALTITRKNIRNAGVGRYIETSLRDIAEWNEAPAAEGVLVTNPPYGERLKVEDISNLYSTLGTKLKHVFKGWHCWVLGFNDDNFKYVGLTPSTKTPFYNGGLQCDLREYVIFEGDKKSFLAAGGQIKSVNRDGELVEPHAPKKPFDRKPREGRKPFDRDRKPFDRDRKPFDRDRKPFDRDRKPFSRDSEKTGRAIRRAFDEDSQPRPERKPFDRDRKPFDREGRKPFDREGRKPFDREGRKPFDREGRKPFDRERKPEDENPLAKHRNERALRYIKKSGPKLEASDQPMMRDRVRKKRNLPPRDNGNDATQNQD